MKTILLLLSCVLVAVSISYGEEQSGNPIQVVNNGPWPNDYFYAIAARYYKSLESKKIDDHIITLNDLSDIVVDTPATSTEKPKSSGVDFNARFSRWGKKPCFLVPLYQVVEHENSQFSKDFKEIFGKSVKDYQAFCATYVLDEKADKNISRVIDPSGMFALGTFSKIDLWLMDEDGKCYVVLSYQPSIGFKGNMSYKALKRLGIHDAKLWNDTK